MNSVSDLKKRKNEDVTRVTKIYLLHWKQILNMDTYAFLFSLIYVESKNKIKKNLNFFWKIANFQARIPLGRAPKPIR